MTLVNLPAVLQPAFKKGYAVAGLVVLGWEEACAYVAAAEEEGDSAILQAGPGCRKHTPLNILGPMFCHLAEQASVPVVPHLDHSYSVDECKFALDQGFTSVMFDGSRKPLAENIADTLAVVKAAESYGAGVEGEVGFVGYDEGEASAASDPHEVATFVQETGVDAVAVSVGNVHLQQSQKAEIDRAALQAIEDLVDIPLVIHGGSGVPSDVRLELSRNSKVCKFNIGTELRMAFGASLRDVLAADAAVFDRNAILSGVVDPVKAATKRVLQDFKPAA